MRATILLATTFALAAACGGGEKPADATSAPAAAPAPVTPDSGAAARDSTAQKMSDTGKRAAGPLRDSAFGPIGAVDEKTGKVTPIKRP